MQKQFILIFFIKTLLVMPSFCLGSPTISEKLNHKIQPPCYSEPTEINASSQEVFEELSPILKRRLSMTNYDRTLPILQFLDHYKKTQEQYPDIRPMDALLTFDLAPCVPSVRGGPCFTLAHDLLQFIPKKYQAYLCLAKLPPKFQQPAFPEFSHVAILIKYSNPEIVSDKGYILLDPSFDIDTPLVLKENGSPAIYDTKVKGIWKFSLSQGQIICELPVNGHTERMVYLTKEVLNPIQSSATPMLIVDRRLSLLSREENGLHIAHLNIELNKNRVIWDKGSKRFDPVSFDSILNGWTFPLWFSKDLFIENKKLADTLRTIIKYKHVLDNLYHDYLKIICETNDTSITGEIDLNKVESILASIK